MPKLVIKPGANPVTQAEVLEYMKAHRPAFPRKMARGRGHKSLPYLRLFSEVWLNNKDKIRTAWYQLGDGKGQPAQVLGYTWTGGSQEAKIF